MSEYWTWIKQSPDIVCRIQQSSWVKHRHPRPLAAPPHLTPHHPVPMSLESAGMQNAAPTWERRDRGCRCGGSGHEKAPRCCGAWAIRLHHDPFSREINWLPSPSRAVAIERYSSFETVSYFLDTVVFSEIKHMKRNAGALPETFFCIERRGPR